jgi:hypothetical protein
MTPEHSDYPGALIGPDGEIYFRRADALNVTADEEHDAEREDATTDAVRTPLPVSTPQQPPEGKEVQ